jgi:endonuclease-8
MSGRWRVLRSDAPVFGTPWLVLRGDDHTGVLWGGPVLELDRGVARRLGPDILADPPDFDAMLAHFRHADQSRAIGEAILDQRLVAGIGNVWKVESLWAERVSPWRALSDVNGDELRRVLESAHRLMRARVESVPGTRHVYRRKGRGCPRCGTPIKSWPQGDDARMAYWCPRCQTGKEPKTA